MGMLTPNSSSTSSSSTTTTRIHPRIGSRRQGTKGSPNGTAAKPKRIPFMLVLLVALGSLLVWQGSRPLHRSSSMYYLTNNANSDFDLMHTISSSSQTNQKNDSIHNNNEGTFIIGVPSGEAVALPNERHVDLIIEQRRKEGGYGGKGDSPHLGGFLNGLDLKSVSPTIWKHMVKTYNIKSVLDLGCGLGHAAAWFDTHGVKTKCVDGSADALNHSIVALEKQSDVLVEHDFALGPCWPAETYDAVWCIDFLPHVSFHHMKHYLPTLRKAALIFFTTSTAESMRWHRVEIHTDDWWTRKFESWGFQYSRHLSRQVQGWAKEEMAAHIATPFKEKSHYNASGLVNLQVFVNPVVSSLPWHDHLFFERGCQTHTTERRDCGDKPEEIKIPVNYQPIQLTAAMDTDWENLVQKGILGKEVVLQSNVTAEIPIVGDPDVTFEELPEILQRIQTRNFTDMPIIPVIAWPYVTRGIGTAEHKHIEENGINESPRLRLSMNLNDFDPNIVWVGDTGWGYGWNLWCGEFLKVIQEARILRRAQGLPDRWPIVIVDFTDNFQLQKCKEIEFIMGSQFIRYTARSMAKRRRWLSDKKWVNFGFKQSFEIPRLNSSYLHTPLVVRTDTIDSLQTTLVKRGMKLTSPIESIPRSKDFIYLWPADNKGINTQFAYFRHRVANIMVELKEKHNLTAYVGLAGKALKTGRHSVSDQYIDIMLDAKVIVVAQRDQWEGHYRLMEALVTGACVLHDFMHGLPAGLQNGTSIVLYSTPEELENLLLYYLEHDEERIEIGRRGREVAMQRHRTWHRMEEVVFGEILTTCESKPPGGNCPYIVHGDEN